MDMALAITEMVLPVLLMFGLGWFCNQKQIFSVQGLAGIKALVGNVLLPVVLFNAFFTAEYSGTIALTFGVVYVSCALGLAAGFLLKHFVKPYDKYMPFLLTDFEGGMLGYALFGLLYTGQTRIFAMVDIGQTLAAYTVFLVTLQAVSTGKTNPKALAKNALSNPAFRHAFGRSAGGDRNWQVGAVLAEWHACERNDLLCDGSCFRTDSGDCGL